MSQQLPNSQVPLQGASLLAALRLEQERRRRAKESTPASYTRPDRNVTFYGGSLELWNSTDSRIIIAGPSDCAKTFSALHIIDRYCWDYPDLVAVIVRKTRSDMGSTVLQTWENKVIKMPKGESVAPGGIYKRGGEHPEFYQYPNGSRVWVVGLDHPGKVLSGEIDLAYVNQCEELNVDDWGTLSTRTSGRAGVLKPGRLIGDANPSQSTHWIKQQQQDGTLRFIEAHHEDNPELYDHTTGTWTEEGIRRLANLKALPGVLGKRLYEGLWVSAEGTVFQPFSTIDEPFAPINYYIASVDWGWTNPGVIQVWGVDGDTRMYRAAELYETHIPVGLPNLGDVISYDPNGALVINSEALALSPDCWVKRALQLHAIFNITTWQCDPSRPEFILEFQKAGLNAVGANNAILQGIQLVEARQKPAGDGYVRIALLRGSRHYPLNGSSESDPYLVEKHLPTCLEEEVEVYVYPKDPASGKAKKNENPVDAHNHGCDPTRYATLHVDGGGGFFFA